MFVIDSKGDQILVLTPILCIGPVVEMLCRLSIDPGQDSSGWPMTLVSSIYQQLSAMGMHIRQHVRDVFSGAKPALSLSRCDQDLGCPLCFHLWLDVGWTLLAFLVTLCKFRIGRCVLELCTASRACKCRSFSLSVS